MSSVAIAVDAFHFLRPFWLLLTPFILVFWWWLKQRGRHSTYQEQNISDSLAPHLRDALTVGKASAHRWHAIDSVMVAVVLASIGAAGPTWSRMADPLVNQSPPLVMALHISDSMEGTDIAPSRLERGKQKLRDLLATRSGDRSALVAYAGSAHQVLPMTEDPSIVQPYLEGLTLDVMPSSGNRADLALGLSFEILQQEASDGAVLLVTDSLERQDADGIVQANIPVIVLAILPEDSVDPGLSALPQNNVVFVTPDDSDIRRVQRLLDRFYQQHLLEDGRQPWEDRGHWLAWPALLLLLLCFRRGVSIRASAPTMLIMVLSFSLPNDAHADVADWFFTSDQQGQIAFNQKKFAQAAESFQDPLWRGYALFRDGQYEAAIEILQRVESADAATLQGIANMRSRHYRDGLRAFELAQKRDPNRVSAAQNVAVAKRIVEYIENAQEQSATEDDTEMKPDELVYDNEAQKGQDVEVSEEQLASEQPISADQWMSSVDTDTGDFLQQRFALEAARQSRTESSTEPSANPPTEHSAKSSAKPSTESSVESPVGTPTGAKQ